MSRPRRSLSLQDSELFGLRSKRNLGQLIGWRGSPSALPKYSVRPTNYRRFNHESASGKVRLIEAPHVRLKEMQRVIEGCLKEIEPPPYLHSGIPGRSYLSNSDAHVRAEGATITLDITDFFLSVTQDLVERLFITHFKCERDIAEILAALVCCDGHLATGSPASPLLSFWACREAFDEIASRARSRGGTFTLYVDDLALTGNGVGRSDILWITRLLKARGLEIKKSKTRTFASGGAKVVTGRAMANGASRAPHKQHKLMKRAVAASQAAPQDAALRATAVGRIRHVALLDDASREALRAAAKKLACPGS